MAYALAAELRRLSLPHVVLDGDDIRGQICRDLSFSKEDRNENVRRIGYLAQLLNHHGVIAIVAAISPYQVARDAVRNNCPRFIEVHLDCSLETLLARDTKGLYKSAIAGRISHFTGISDPYEKPVQPEIYLNSDTQSEDESLSLLLSKLDELDCLPSQRESFEEPLPFNGVTHLCRTR